MCEQNILGLIDKDIHSVHEQSEKDSNSGTRSDSKNLLAQVSLSEIILLFYGNS